MYVISLLYCFRTVLEVSSVPQCPLKHELSAELIIDCALCKSLVLKPCRCLTLASKDITTKDTVTTALPEVRFVGLSIARTSTHTDQLSSVLPAVFIRL